jgi:hypothetical protein
MLEVEDAQAGCSGVLVRPGSAPRQPAIQPTHPPPHLQRRLQQDPSADPVITYLATAVRNLVNLTFASNTSWGTRHVPRGLLNPVAAKLVNVERSAIPACAVTDLAASLAPLENLTELSLEGSFTLGLDPEASEVVGLIDAETGMRQLTLGKALHQRLFRGPPWSDQERSEVERAAERKGMNLVWG